jgi:hypothetical protein
VPLTKKGKTILTAMRDQYGPRAENVFYASINKGTITGAEKAAPKKKGK